MRHGPDPPEWAYIVGRGASLLDASPVTMPIRDIPVVSINHATVHLKQWPNWCQNQRVIHAQVDCFPLYIPLYFEMWLTKEAYHRHYPEHELGYMFPFETGGEFTLIRVAKAWPDTKFLMLGCDLLTRGSKEYDTRFPVGNLDTLTEKFKPYSSRFFPNDPELFNSIESLADLTANG